jgi:hypothetical protein
MIAMGAYLLPAELRNARKVGLLDGRTDGAERALGDARKVGAERKNGVDRIDGDAPMLGDDRNVGDVRNDADGDGDAVMLRDDPSEGSGPLRNDADGDGDAVMLRDDPSEGSGPLRNDADGDAAMVDDERGPRIEDDDGSEDGGLVTPGYGGSGVERLGAVIDDAIASGAGRYGATTAGAENDSRGTKAADAGSRPSPFDDGEAAAELQWTGGLAPAATAVRGAANACARAMP